MIEKLAKAIQYPDPVPEGVSTFDFDVDSTQIRAIAFSDRLILRCNLPASDENTVLAARFAAGRLLREEAVPAWDEREEVPFLWQEVPVGADTETLQSVFEQFADSCDWWLARLGETDTPPSVFPDIMIRP